jgi:methylated-DNA-[protein]-cysteine S-methyltransferase
VAAFDSRFRTPDWEISVSENGEQVIRFWLPWHEHRITLENAVKRYVSKVIDSPVGPLELVASETGLAAILWKDDDPQRVPLTNVVRSDNDPILLEAERQLGEYFAGKRTGFALPLDFAGTDFQRRVWHALLTIPFGETRTYGQIAQQIGSPAAVRAVGAANGRNPISIVTPCHRVIGSSGELRGFAGGLQTKAWLLGLEGRQARLPIS